MREVIKNYFIKLSNNIFLIVLPLVILFLAWESVIFYLIYWAIIIYYFKKKRGCIFETVIIISIILIITLIILDKIYDCNRYQNEELEIEGMIVEKDIYESQYGTETYRYKITVRQVKDKSFLIKKNCYVFIKDNYDIGDVIKVNGNVREIDGEKIEHSFDYENYLNKAKIYLILNGNKSEKTSSNFTINKIKTYINNYFNKHFEGDTLVLLKGLVLGDDSGFSSEFDAALRENGILHLFAVSGLHITLFITMLSFVFKLFKIKEEIYEKIIIGFLVLYVIITSFAVSIVRASLMYLLGIINKRKLNKLFSSLDVVSFAFLILVLINPYYAYNTGFILSFMVSFVIVLVSSLLKEKSNSFQILVISLISNLFTLPVIININYEYNLLTPVINVLYISLVSDFILPFGFITLIFPILSYSYDYIIKMFVRLIDFTSNISLSIKLSYFNSISIILFYGALFGFILFINNRKIKKICILLLFLFVTYSLHFSSYRINPEINFLYLNDGDCTIINYKDQTIVIDTGDGVNDEARNTLMSKGVRKIDYLIITHAHDDHYGGVEGIIERIKVEHIVTSNIYKYNYENQLRVNPFDELKLNDIDIIFLSPKDEYIEENANSLTFIMKIRNKTMLFLGDSTSLEEKEILQALISLDIKKIDLIKIAHHGSDTGNSEELISFLKIDYAIIMVGKLRKSTHPSNIILDRLEKHEIKTYITSKSYSIKLEIKNDAMIFNTLKK